MYDLVEWSGYRPIPVDGGGGEAKLKPKPRWYTCFVSVSQINIIITNNLYFKIPNSYRFSIK